MKDIKYLVAAILVVVAPTLLNTFNVIGVTIFLWLNILAGFASVGLMYVHLLSRMETVRSVFVEVLGWHAAVTYSEYFARLSREPTSIEIPPIQAFEETFSGAYKVAAELFAWLGVALIVYA